MELREKVKPVISVHYTNGDKVSCTRRLYSTSFSNIASKVNTYSTIFFIYLLVLIIATFTIIPYVDSYYYWLWSEHFQLSYIDGPPMIGYIIKLFSLIFGNSVLAINMVGLSIVIVTSVIIMRIVYLLSGNKNLDLFLVFYGLFAIL